jgi:ABC-type sugar transport system substrate-binding protein
LARPPPTRSPLGEGAVDQDVLGVGLVQGPGQAGRAAGEEVGDRTDVGVGGTDTDPEAGRDLDEGVVLAQVDQRDDGSLRGPELAPAVTLPGDDEHGDPLDESVRQVQ